MRVMICCETFYPKVDGTVRMVSIMADHLKARGHEVMILAPDLSPTPDEVVTEYNGMPVMTFGGPRFWCYPEFVFALPNVNIYRAIKTFQPDVMHLFHPGGVGLWALIVAKMLRIPTVASFHIDIARAIKGLGVRPWLVRLLAPGIDFLTWLVLCSTDYRLATSQHIQERLTKLGVPRVAVWMRGVDQEMFNPKHDNHEMRVKITNGKPDSKILLYVGRLSGEKRVHDLRALVEQIPDATLVLVGDGAQRAELEAYFAGTNTVFMGHISGLTLSQTYASADVFVFPSSIETFGLVVLEAMAAKLPVVATRVGGIPTVITEGVNGYTIDVGDTEALVKAVKQVLRDDAQRQVMAQNAYDYASQLSWEKANDAVIEQYHRLVQSRVSLL